MKSLFYAFVVILIPVFSASAIQTQPFSAIPVVSSQEKIFLLSGLGQTSGTTLPFRNDVWTSAGGLSTWSQLSAHGNTTTKWSPRSLVASTYFNNKIWVINGSKNANANTPLNDVWSSPDGVNWTQVLAQAPWTGGEGATLTVFKGKMWLIGGGTGIGDGVWSSADGVTWTQSATVASSTCLIRWGHQTAVFNNKLWIVGNGNPISTGHDLCSSSDGIHWNVEVPYTPWGMKTQFSMLSYNNKLWVIGGTTAPYGPTATLATNDVWSSSDGIHWTQTTLHAPWQARTGFTGFTYNGKMWVAGGLSTTGSFLNDVWYSTDGLGWTRATGAAAWSARAQHAVVVASQGTSLQLRQRMTQISAK